MDEKQESNWSDVLKRRLADSKKGKTRYELTCLKYVVDEVLVKLKVTLFRFFFRRVDFNWRLCRWAETRSDNDKKAEETALFTKYYTEWKGGSARDQSYKSIPRFYYRVKYQWHVFDVHATTAVQFSQHERW